MGDDPRGGAAGALVGGLIALRVRFARPLVAVLLSVVPAAVVLLLLGIAAPLWVIVPVSFVSGAFLAIGGPSGSRHCRRRSPSTRSPG